MNLCAIGISFVDQLDDNPNLLNDVLINAQEQLDSVKRQLSEKYDKYYSELVANGYETQLNNSTILDRVTFFANYLRKKFIPSFNFNRSLLVGTE